MRFDYLGAMLLLCLTTPALAGAEEIRPQQPALPDPGFGQLMGDFGQPAIPVARRAEASGAGVIYDFSDGSRLAVRRSRSAIGKISVNGVIGSGRLGLPEKLVQSAWGMAFLPLGGTSAASYEEIEQWLAASGHSVELNFNPELRGFRFWGSTSTQDLGYQIGLLCGIVRHAGMREVVSRKAAEFGSTLPLQIEMNPQLVLARAIGRAASGLGAHYDELPLAAEISPDLAGDLQAIADREFTGPIDLAVVGDIDPDTVATYVGQTCAAGSRTAAPRQFQPLIAHFEGGAHRWTFVKSPTDGPSSIEALAWPTGDYGKGDRHRLALDLLADVLRVRLSLHLSTTARRVVPLVAVTTGFVPDRFGFFAVAVEGPSTDALPLTRLIGVELKALLQDPALDGQIAAVSQARAANRAARLASNQQQAAAMADSLSNPEAITRFEQIETGDPASVTADVRHAAQWLVNESRQAKITLQPRD